MITGLASETEPSEVMKRKVTIMEDLQSTVSTRSSGLTPGRELKPILRMPTTSNNLPLLIANEQSSYFLRDDDDDPVGQNLNGIAALMR